MPKVQDELADWIDPTVIAGTILEELRGQGVEATLENGQAVWLDSLEDLHHLAAYSIAGLIIRGKMKS